MSELRDFDWKWAKLEALARAAGSELADDIEAIATRVAPRDTGRLAASHFQHRTPSGHKVLNRAPYARFVERGIAGTERVTPQPWGIEAIVRTMGRPY